MAKKNIPMDEEIIDLTELIETGPKSRGKAASAYAAAASPPAEDNFENILAESQASPPKRKVDPHETLDMGDMGGIDDLLESLDIPAQPREATAQGEASDDELDSVLDDLLGNDKPVKKEEPPKAAPAAEPSGLDDDLDDLLGPLDSPKKSEPVTPPAEVLPDLDADLDDILAEMEPPRPPEPEAAPAEAVSAEAEPDLSAGMEEVEALPDVEPPLDSELPHTDEPAPAAEPEIDFPESDTPVGNLEEATPPPPEGTAIPGEIELEPEEPPQDHPAESLSPQPEDSVLPVQAWPADALATICRNLAGGQGALQDFSRELGEQTAHMADMGTQVLQLSRRILACESKISSARARIAALEKGLENISALDDLLREGTPLNAGFMALISSAIANALKGFNFPVKAATDESFNADMEKLDAGLWRADQRIEALEQKAVKADALEARLDALEKTVALLKGHDPESKIAELDAASRGANARILSLEKEVEQLQAGAGKLMEKAAAATVAKVLHEEISRLAQS